VGATLIRRWVSIIVLNVFAFAMSGLLRHPRKWEAEARTMTTQTTSVTPINDENLHALIGGVLQDLGGAFSVPLVQMGESLGLYQALSDRCSFRPSQTSQKNGRFDTGC
jgi:hypothetical protein